MDTLSPPPWLRWARELQAMSQTGLTYSLSTYDTERYRRLAAIAAEIVAAHTGVPTATVLTDFLAQPGYATPKVDVRGALVRDGQVLLVQERSDARWCLPGGWADVGATPSEMVVREVWEESNVRVAPRKLVGVFDGNRVQEPLALYHAYKLVFLCELVEGEPQPGEETRAVGWFPFDALPPLSMERTAPRHLTAVEAHWRDPHLPPNVD